MSRALNECARLITGVGSRSERIPTYTKSDIWTLSDLYTIEGVQLIERVRRLSRCQLREQLDSGALQFDDKGFGQLVALADKYTSPCHVRSSRFATYGELTNVLKNRDRIEIMEETIMNQDSFDDI